MSMSALSRVRQATVCFMLSTEMILETEQYSGRPSSRPSYTVADRAGQSNKAGGCIQVCSCPPSYIVAKRVIQ